MKKDSFWLREVGEVAKSNSHIPEFLSKEIKLRKDGTEDTPQTVCFSCGNTTPSTISTCLVCGDPIKVSSDIESPDLTQSKQVETRSFIEMAEELL